MSSQDKINEDCRFVFLSPGVLRNDGQNLHFTAFDTHLRSRVLIQRYSRQMSKEALSQVQLLRHLEHDNLALMHHVMHLSPSGPCYLVSELLDTTLEQLLLSSQLTFNYASLFAYQMLRGLKYLHSADLSHLRMQPSNTLINVHSFILKLSDSWVSLTDQVSEHSYSSPEVLMGMEDTGDVRKADVWSVGCMLLEMVADRNIFQGHDQFDTLLRIIDTVVLKDLDWMKVFKFFPTRVFKNHSCKPRYPLSHFMPACDASLINLLESMLRFCAGDRTSLAGALSHPFFSAYHCPEDEPVVDPDVLRILQRVCGVVWHGRFVAKFFNGLVQLVRWVLEGAECIFTSPRQLSEQGEADSWLSEACSLQELWNLELQAGLSDNHVLDYLSTPSFLHSSTHLNSSLISDHPFGSNHSVHDATREQSLSSSSSGSVHSAATYRHNLKELQSRLKQRYAGDSDKESAEMSEEKRKEEEEVAMVQQALQQLACVNIHDAEDKVVRHKESHETEDCKAKDPKRTDANCLKVDDLNELSIGNFVSNDLQLQPQEESTCSLTEGQPQLDDLVAFRGEETLWSKDEGGRKKRGGRMEVGKRASEGTDGWKQEGKQGLETDPFDHPSSHFDHLYRLPTDHLRRYADDMNHSLHGHHFFDATCRTSRLSEGGACGGCDYGSLDDIPSAFSSSHHLSTSPDHFRHPPVSALFKRSGSDSSFESPPNSPPFSALHTGARPKRSYKKFFK